MNIFDVLKTVRLNHEYFPSQKMVITDVDGKPNSLLTDLLRDVLTKVEILIDLDRMNDAFDIVDSLKETTPLPDDVLDEYSKILTQKIVQVNFVSKRNELELVYDPSLL